MGEIIAPDLGGVFRFAKKRNFRRPAKKRGRKFCGGK